jgi:hypothetical protein
MLGCSDNRAQQALTQPSAEVETLDLPERTGTNEADAVQPTAANEIQNSPLTISAERTPSLGVGGWRLKIDSAGKGELITEHFNESTRTPVKLTEAQLKEFREVLLRARFFDLAKEYGGQVPDGHVETITITAGEKTKTVTIRYVHWDGETKAEFRRAVPALCVWVGLKKLADPEGKMLRPEHPQFLKAIEP